MVKGIVRRQHGLESLQVIMIVALAAFILLGIRAIWETVMQPQLDTALSSVLEDDFAGGGRAPGGAGAAGNGRVPDGRAGLKGGNAKGRERPGNQGPPRPRRPWWQDLLGPAEAWAEEPPGGPNEGEGAAEGQPKERPLADILPKDRTKQWLLAALYAESSTRFWGGGENADEKDHMGIVFVNQAYYATLTNARGRNYNTSFGDGTIESAIRLNSDAYKKRNDRRYPRWKQMMDGDALKSAVELEKTLTPDDLIHLRESINSLERIPAAGAPHASGKLEGRIPIGFNKAQNSPPHPPRNEWVGRFGSHSFYAHRPGREIE